VCGVVEGGRRSRGSGEGGEESLWAGGWVGKVGGGKGVGVRRWEDMVGERGVWVGDGEEGGDSGVGWGGNGGGEQ